MKNVLLVFIALMVGFMFYSKLHHENSPSASPIVANHDKVILYATSWCGYCKKTRELLTENKIEYVEYDIETSEEGRLQHEQLGGNGVPVLDVKGTVIHGFDEEEITNTLKDLQLINAS
jgi:mycoredoxin